MARLNVAATLGNIIGYARRGRGRDTDAVLVKTGVESGDSRAVKASVPHERERQKTKVGFSWVVPLGVIAVTAAAAPNEIEIRQTKKIDIFWLPLVLVAIIGLSLAVALIGTVAVWKLLQKSDQRLPGFLRRLPGGRRGVEPRSID